MEEHGGSALVVKGRLRAIFPELGGMPTAASPLVALERDLARIEVQVEVSSASGPSRSGGRRLPGASSGPEGGVGLYDLRHGQGDPGR